MSLNTHASVRNVPFVRACLALPARCLLLLSGAYAMGSHAVENVGFNPAFFPDGAGGQHVDITKFSQGNIVLPGNYRTDVYLNGQWIGRETLTFVATEGRDSAQMCLERDALLRFGIDLDAPKDQPGAPPPDYERCADIARYLPGSTGQFDPGENRLTLQVPQIYLARKVRGFVDPKHWDGGIDAAFVRYNANTFATRTQGRSLDSHYLGLNSGLNLGDWH